MKWDVVNSLPFTSSEDQSFKVPSQSHKLSLYLFSSSSLIKICLLILQILFNSATLFVKVPNGSSSINGRFIFSSPSDEFMNNIIDVRNEDVLYNWMEKTFMFLSKVGSPSGPLRKCILLWLRH